MLNLNAKELKPLRDALALYHIADFNKADADISKSKYIRQREIIIASNLESIAKIDRGECKTVGGKTKAQIEAQNVELQNEINAKREEIMAKKAEFDKNIAVAIGFLTEDLRVAGKAYLANPYKEELENAFAEAFAKWFNDNGAKSASALDCKKFVRPMGVMIGSSRTKCMTNNHTRAVSGKSFDQLLLDVICDEPTVKALLPIKKWENVIERKTKKSAE
jgi:hypothetical protein